MVDVTKKALGVMRDENPQNGAQQGGVIANISSMGGWMGFPSSSFYHASKFAMEGWTESVAKELPSSWNSMFSLFYPLSLMFTWLAAANSHTTTNTRRHLVHLCLIEPGGIKTNYATSSLKHMAERHPSYADSSYPTNIILSYMLQEENRSAWAEPSELAEAIYLVISRGQRIPIRVPLGSDAWGMIMKDLADTKKDLDELKDISLGVGDAKQLVSINFLK